jgi:hypothetical protein
MELMGRTETKEKQFQLHQLLQAQQVRREHKVRKARRVRKAKLELRVRVDLLDQLAQQVQLDRKDHRVVEVAVHKDRQVQLEQPVQRV